MSTQTQVQDGDVKARLQALATLRDEIRVRLHLAGMDAKDRWRDLEESVRTIEHSAAEAASAVTKGAVDEAIRRLERFKASIG